MEKKTNIFVRGKNWIFGSNEHLGLTLMVIALFCFFCCANNEIPANRYFGLEKLKHWWTGTSRLDMGLRLGNTFAALLFVIVLYGRNIFKFDIRKVAEENTKKTFRNIVKLSINVAVISAYICMLTNPCNHDGFSLGSILGGSLFIIGLIAGIVIFGSKQTASIAAFVLLIVILIKMWENFSMVSSAMGIWGFVFMIATFFGFVLQESINFAALKRELSSLFSFGKKIATEGLDAVGEIANPVKKDVMKN